MILHLLDMKDSGFAASLKALSAQERGRGFSKSYTDGVMAVCVSQKAHVGIDLEVKQPRSPETIRYFLEKFKTFDILDTPRNVDVQWFYTAWTAMESYLKLAGFGFFAQKNFAINTGGKAILCGGKEVAWFEHFYIENLIICICSDKKIVKQDVEIKYHGWEGRK
ncbi:MAG: 4'-phosphopantetheinyl transferase superfamily protein [Defluviitaleaceae bacterium]|nr:4'-phosphopantetheinyl transferase superfamily protein [Defluviitaleaceae bacterium]